LRRFLSDSTSLHPNEFHNNWYYGCGTRIANPSVWKEQHCFQHPAWCWRFCM
jgi:hypothetical protein